MKEKAYTTVHISAAVWFSAVCSLFLVSHRKGLLFLMLFLCLINLFLYRKQNADKYIFYGVILNALLCAGYLLTRNEYIWYTACVCAGICGIYEGIRYLREKKYVWHKPFKDDKFYWVLHLAGILFLAWGFVRLSLLSFQPDQMVRRMNPEAVNTAEYGSVVKEPYEENNTAVRNIPYDDEYPNSVFDLLLPEEENPPVIVWLHGGSFVSGSRNSEDHTKEFFSSLLHEGFAIVTADYALTPDYRYPVPLIQTERLMNYLRDHPEELGIDTDRIVLAGTGSGAELALQYLTAAYNPDYAAETGITPVRKESLKAAYLKSVCYQPQFSDESNFVLTDFIMYQQARSYYGSFSLHESEKARLADCTPYLTSDLPPLLIGEGNTGTYTVQAHRADALLTQLNVPYTSKIFDAGGNNKNLIGLSFDTEYNTYAGAVHGEFLRFLRDHGISPKKNTK